jgi:hypothetical protein
LNNTPSDFRVAPRAHETKRFINADGIVRRIDGKPTGIPRRTAGAFDGLPESATDAPILSGLGDEQVIEVKVIANASEADDYPISLSTWPCGTQLGSLAGDAHCVRSAEIRR